MLTFSSHVDIPAEATWSSVEVLIPFDFSVGR